MSIIWWIFLPSLYLLIAALVKIFAARAQADEQMTSEEIEFGPGRAYFTGDVMNAKAPTEEYGDDCQ